MKGWPFRAALSSIFHFYFLPSLPPLLNFKYNQVLCRCTIAQRLDSLFFIRLFLGHYASNSGLTPSTCAMRLDTFALFLLALVLGSAIAAPVELSPRANKPAIGSVVIAKPKDLNPIPFKGNVRSVLLYHLSSDSWALGCNHIDRDNHSVILLSSLAMVQPTPTRFMLPRFRTLPYHRRRV